MIAQILYSAIGVLIAIGILAAVFGAKSWFDRLVQRHEDSIRNLHSRIDCINRRLDRVDGSLDAFSRELVRQRRHNAGKTDDDAEKTHDEKDRDEGEA